MFHRGAILFLLLSVFVRADDTATPAQLAFFETHIRPVLVERCLDCHNSDTAESDLDLTSRASLLRGGKLGKAVLPGRPAESLLISAIRHDEFLKMPPKEKLSTRDVVNFTKWVEMGAPWPGVDAQSAASSDHIPDSAMSFTEEQLTHWSFRPVTDPVPPSVNSDWPSSEIDHFILRRLQDAGLTPAAPSDRRTLIRRATYDLTGLPPTPEETSEFLADGSPDAFSKVIDRLLASPRYGERWGRHWLDVARYADSNGLDENISYANAWHYRDYVIDAFNSDKPYARFVQEQIAGDLLPAPEDNPDDMSRFIATGFLALGPKMLAEDDPMKMQMDIIDEQLSTMSQTFMGLTMGCARCHDHKFDPLPTEDYYSLAGIFKSSRTMENHKVVAVWYERPLVPPSMLEKIDESKRLQAETQQKIDDFTKKQRTVMVSAMRRQLGAYLLAATEIESISQQTARRPAAGKQTTPFCIENGVVELEAEAFHRGNIESQTTGYGEGIGIVGSRGPGFIEFDVVAEHPGVFQIELRHAAADARPVELHVNGALVDDTVAGQVTGSWYPPGQRWFPAGQVELTAGKNLIRLERDGVFPHIDRLVLLRTDREAADTEIPYLSEIAQKHDVQLDLVEVWRSFLADVRRNETGFPGFRLWLDVSATSPIDVASQGQGGAPQVLVEALETKGPQSLSEVAAVYTTFASGDVASLPASWLEAPSPLAGPAEIHPWYLSGDSRKELQQLRAARAKYAEDLPTMEVAMGITEATPADIRVHMRGSHIALGQIAPRRFPRIIGDLNAEAIDPDQSGRLQLAQWMTRSNHPLLWRVMANRVWYWHFGRGLTPSVDNFGLLGQAPTHPELLDWLASRLVEDGGSLKELHRRIMLSQTWQMSTNYNATAESTDPENELLWRFRRRRLSAEEMRDTLISLGSGLDLAMGGSLLKVKNRAYVTSSGTSITTEFKNHRRSVFLPVVRSSVFDVLQALDFPDPAVPTGQRQTSTIAPQALMLMNSDLAEEQSLAMAQRLLKITDQRQRVYVGYGLALNRPPETHEIEQMQQFVDEVRRSLEDSDERADLKSWQSFCRVLLSSNEFAYLE